MIYHMPIIIKNPYGILDIGDNPYEISYGKSINASNPRYHTLWLFNIAMENPL